MPRSNPESLFAADDHAASATAPAVVADVVCLGCGCLCDDIEVVVDRDREKRAILATKNTCDLGVKWFEREIVQTYDYPAMIDGSPATIEAAIERSVNILSTARRPLVLGLEGLTIEAQRSAVDLVDAIRGFLVTRSLPGTDIAHRGVQRVGIVSCTLGEVRHRADLIVHWRSDPVVTHPRHGERYGANSIGRFVPRGRADRRVISVDVEPTATAAQADEFIKISSENEYETLVVLRALVRGVPIDRGRAERRTKIDFEILKRLSETLKSARYGAWTWDESNYNNNTDILTIESILALVGDLNEGSRFVAVELGGSANRAGATAVSTWRSGYPGSVDFASGAPRYLPEIADPAALIESREVDAILTFQNLAWIADLNAIKHAAQVIPTIVVAPANEPSGFVPSVSIATASLGLNEVGTIIRVDGAALSLNPPLESDRPSAAIIIKEIHKRFAAERSHHKRQTDRESNGLK
jgi:formylmethanofuran dehydrogenase subunit B